MKKRILLGVGSIGVIAVTAFFLLNTNKHELLLVNDVKLGNGPELQDKSLVNAPLYYYLFTHTEDPFNHELSEDRYWRIGEMIETAQKSFPTTDITWTIQFQGSDANTVAERNASTGLLDYLLDMKTAGLMEFGYHGYHDPTYIERPQKQLSDNPSYDDIYEALYTWVTCLKALPEGGCVSDWGGGLTAVDEHFGQVEVVSGIGVGQGFQMERSAGAAAILELLPDRMLGFGFPDHGATLNSSSYLDARNEIVELMSPTHETHSALLWMDNILIFNDGIPLDNVNNLEAKKGLKNAMIELQKIDRTRPQILKVGIADKFIYTATGTSPTIYGYSHPDSPELPKNLIKSPKEIEINYQNTEDVINELAQLASTDDSIAFIHSDGIVDAYTSDDYWTVDASELEQIALWTIKQWDRDMPLYTYDGEDFYSLTDSFYLFIAATQNKLKHSEDYISKRSGPWNALSPTMDAQTVSTASLRKWAQEFNLKDKGPIPSPIQIDSQAFDPAQILYGLAMITAMDAQGITSESIALPAGKSTPHTLELLEGIGCKNCLDSAWSMKPARYQSEEL